MTWWTSRVLKNVYGAALDRQNWTKRGSLCSINDRLECNFNDTRASELVFQQPAGPKPTKAGLRKKTTRLCALFIICLLAGSVLIGQGLWIHAKALTAQVLIADAWEQSLARQQPVKPWAWADTWPVARLQGNAQNVDLFVLEGGHGQALAFGPGRLLVPSTNTSSDTGTNTNFATTVLAGHRDTHFRFLAKTEVNDPFQLTDQQGISQYYRVTSMTVEDSRTQALYPEESGLTLVTCYPFDAITAGGPLRYVVRMREVKNQKVVEASL